MLCSRYLSTLFLATMTEDNNATIGNNNNNNEQCSVFSEHDKELAHKAKQEYETGQFDGLFVATSVGQDDRFAF